MASTCIDLCGNSAKHHSDVNKIPGIKDDNALDIEDYDGRLSDATTVTTSDRTHRMLKPRHIQLIGIGFVLLSFPNLLDIFGTEPSL
jgi:amino acid permease